MNPNFAWPPVSVRQRLIEHRELIVTVRKHRDDPDVDQALSRYLVVRSAGLVESVRDDVADFYVKRVAHVRAHRRIVSGLRRGQGIAPNQLVTFVRSFDAAWAEDLDTLLQSDDSRIRDGLGALVAARRKIAHGDGESVSTSKALQWGGIANEVCQWLIKRFEP